MRYYLSGAITDQPNFKEYFQKHEDELRHWGLCDIFNPASLDWLDDASWEVCMRYDIEKLMSCDILVLLPNWKKSKGAKVEADLCKKIGIPVIKFNDLIRKLMPHAT